MYYSTNICCADELENLINSTPDGEVCTLENKEYYISRRVVIKNKNNVTINGNNATIVSKYVNSDDYTKSVDAFLIKHCNNLALTNLFMDTSVPPSIVGTFKEIDKENKTAVIKIDDDFKINGNEVLMTFNTIDADGSSDYHMHYYAQHPDRNIVTVVFGEVVLANTYSSAKYDYLGNNTYKVYFNTPFSNLLRVGERVSIRHTMYGPAAITVSDSNKTLIKNVTMYHVPGMAIVVLPRSTDMVVDGLKVVAKEGANCLMPGNCDGIHLTGLHGDFVLKNSVFDGLGDDALNIHATAGTITQLIDENTVKCNYCKKSPDGVLPVRWCEPGDTIITYDPINMQKTAELKATDFTDGILKFELISGEYKLGDTMQNLTYAPTCTVDNCIIRNSRARGVVIQTSNVEIKNNVFFGASSAAIKVAPDFNYWYEVGPTYNLSIHDNVIEKCSFRSTVDPDIVVFTKHSTTPTDVEHLHKNITIENNVIKRSLVGCVSITATDGVTIKNNRFEGRQDRTNPAIKTHNCTDVVIENNIEI